MCAKYNSLLSLERDVGVWKANSILHFQNQGSWKNRCSVWQSYVLAQCTQYEELVESLIYWTV